LSDTPPPPPEIPNPKPNGAILTVCKTIRNVMTSAAEAETDGVYENGQEIIAIRILLQALGHPQLATLLKTDNSTLNSFVHANIKQHRSKTWDMRWNWLSDKVTHQQLRMCTGPKEQTTMPTILRNTIYRRITLLRVQNMF